MQLLVITVMALLAASLALPAKDSFAANRERKVVVSPQVVRHGHVVSKLPARHMIVRVRGTKYHYHKGVFYRPRAAGYIAVRAPIGAVVVSLPLGYKTVWVGDKAYFHFGGVFYIKTTGGYTVVESPPDVLVVDETPQVVEPSLATSGEATVTARLLNVRTGPGYDYEIHDQVVRGDTLEIYGKDGLWIYVKLPGEEFGWVRAEYIKRAASPARG